MQVLRVDGGVEENLSLVLVTLVHFSLRRPADQLVKYHIGLNKPRNKITNRTNKAGQFQNAINQTNHKVTVP